MQKFLVLYLAPAAGMAEWMKTDPAVRKEAEDKMKAEWDAWMKANRAMIKETTGAGATKRITTAGIADVKNDVMLYSIAEGESQETVAKAFEHHPHLAIPGGSIDIMPANRLPGMDGM